MLTARSVDDATDNPMGSLSSGDPAGITANLEPLNVTAWSVLGRMDDPVAACAT